MNEQRKNKNENMHMTVNLTKQGTPKRLHSIAKKTFLTAVEKHASYQFPGDIFEGQSRPLTHFHISIKYSNKYTNQGKSTYMYPIGF